jgi:hypothetical protein
MRTVINRIAVKTATVAVTFFGLVGCGGVGHTLTAPVRMVHHDSTPPPKSDVDVPGQPVAATPTPTPRPRVAAKKTKSQKPPPSGANQPSSSQFPVAKAVPGKPGLVYNPFDPKGGLIDVSGYAPGSKVKDPDSQRIFVVP